MRSSRDHAPSAGAVRETAHPAIGLQDVIFNLYHSEINASISWFWDGGLEVKLGDEMNGWKAEANFAADDFPKVAAWLDAEARRFYPQSAYAAMERA